MRTKRKGFTMIEMLLGMVIFTFLVMSANSYLIVFRILGDLNAFDVVLPA